MIPSLTNYSGIVSDISWKHIRHRCIIHIFRFWRVFGIYSGIVSSIYSDILSYIFSGICSDILSGIPSGSLFGILFGILSGILSDIFSNSSGILLSGLCSGPCPAASGARDTAGLAMTFGNPGRSPEWRQAGRRWGYSVRRRTKRRTRGVR